MNFSYLLGLRGRINRFQLLMGQVIAIVPFVLVSLVAENLENPWRPTLTAIFMVLLLLITLCMGVKRLHDSDHSSWLILLAFVPLANLYLAFLLYFTPGTDGENRFGPPS